MKKIFIITVALMATIQLWAQADTATTLKAASISAHRDKVQRLNTAENGLLLGQDELFRAACCNLGESFVNNASVDVNYNDAAVGARQIKLLGLSGQYVQMLTEQLPNLTGAAMPYSLSYVPGAWMQSISVSKGASSVKNGFQSITGQINVDYLKPDDEEGLVFNLYGDSHNKRETNLVGNKQLGHHLSAELLIHYEKDFGHSDEDGDNWHDTPSIEQLHLQSRWKMTRGRYIGHWGVGILDENREGGQLLKVDNPFRVLLDGRRYEGYMKHAYIINQEHNSNVAFMATANHYELDGQFGPKHYSNQYNNIYAQLMFEHEFNFIHSISTGLSLMADKMDEVLNSQPSSLVETTPGIYAQYTFKPSHKLTAMAGLRADYSNRIDAFFATPRLHLKWMPTQWLSLRLSTGKGYRSAYALAEHHYLLSSGRTLNNATTNTMEEAWNSGISATFTLPIGERFLKLNLEEYYTHFLQQVVVDYDSNPLAINLVDLNGRSFSHTIQVDASYDFTDELDATVAYRFNDVKCTYNGVLMEKPLTSRYKGLVTLSWRPWMGKWQFDFTFQMNGGGRMPTPYLLPDDTPSWEERFPAYPQINAQITRKFRHFSCYIGGENLTNYKQPNAVINAENPWSNTFEPTMIWGPVRGTMLYAGIRANLFEKK